MEWWCSWIVRASKRLNVSTRSQVTLAEASHSLYLWYQKYKRVVWSEELEDKWLVDVERVLTVNIKIVSQKIGQILAVALKTVVARVVSIRPYHKKGFLLKRLIENDSNCIIAENGQYRENYNPLWVTVYVLRLPS